MTNNTQQLDVDDYYEGTGVVQLDSAGFEEISLQPTNTYERTVHEVTEDMRDGKNEVRGVGADSGTNIVHSGFAKFLPRLVRYSFVSLI